MVKLNRISDHSYVDCLKPDAKIIDLGVNQGLFSYEMIKRHNAIVYGAEPDPDLYAALKQCERLQVLNVAVSTNRGAIQLLKNRESCPTVRREVLQKLKDPISVTVPTITFGEFIEEFDLECADLLKIDIEGAEIDVIPMISKRILNNIDQITVEFHGFLFDEDHDSIYKAISYLRENNFFYIDMSRNKTDVLFINKRVLKKSWILHIVLTKYYWGIRRAIKRRIRTYKNKQHW